MHSNIFLYIIRNEIEEKNNLLKSFYRLNHLIVKLEISFKGHQAKRHKPLEDSEIEDVEYIFIQVEMKQKYNIVFSHSHI